MSHSKSLRDFRIPNDANADRYEKYGLALARAAELEALGYRRRRSSGTGFKDLRPGQLVVCPHDVSWWVIWKEAVRV